MLCLYKMTGTVNVRTLLLASLDSYSYAVSMVLYSGKCSRGKDLWTRYNEAFVESFVSNVCCTEFIPLQNTNFVP